MRVVFSGEAAADLEEIGDYIARHNARRALTFIAELRDAALGLADAPHAFPLVPRYKHHGIRRRPIGNYLIFYRVEGNQISIVHILHGARDFEALLFPQD